MISEYISLSGPQYIPARNIKIAVTNTTDAKIFLLLLSCIITEPWINLSLCDSYHLPHICPETDASRDKVANFCAVITNEFFMEGVNYDIDSMDQVIVSLEKANNKIQNRDIMHNIESEIQI